MMIATASSSFIAISVCFQEISKAHTLFVYFPASSGKAMVEADKCFLRTFQAYSCAGLAATQYIAFKPERLAIDREVGCIYRALRFPHLGCSLWCSAVVYTAAVS